MGSIRRRVVAKVRFRCACGELLEPPDAGPGDVVHCSRCKRRYRLPEEKKPHDASAETMMASSSLSSM